NFFCKNEVDRLSDIKDKDLLFYFTNKKIMISVGSTIEYIDPIRIITNKSSGKMGLSLITQSLKYGLDVTIVKGMTQIDEKFKEISSTRFNNRLQIIETKTTDQMAEAITRELEKTNYDFVILAAAVSDFKPSTTSEKKISTDNPSLQLNLVPTVKIVEKVK